MSNDAELPSGLIIPSSEVPSADAAFTALCRRAQIAALECIPSTLGYDFSDDLTLTELRPGWGELDEYDVLAAHFINEFATAALSGVEGKVEQLVDDPMEFSFANIVNESIIKKLPANLAPGLNIYRTLLRAIPAVHAMRRPDEPLVAEELTQVAKNSMRLWSKLASTNTEVMHAMFTLMIIKEVDLDLGKITLPMSARYQLGLFDMEDDENGRQLVVPDFHNLMGQAKEILRGVEFGRGDAGRRSHCIAMDVDIVGQGTTLFDWALGKMADAAGRLIYPQEVELLDARRVDGSYPALPDIELPKAPISNEDLTRLSMQSYLGI